MGAVGPGLLRNGSGGSARSGTREVRVMSESGDTAGLPSTSLLGAGAAAGDGVALSSRLTSCALGAWDTAGAADVSPPEVGAAAGNSSLVAAGLGERDARYLSSSKL